MLPTLTAQFVSARCAAGQVIDYRVVSGVDHGEIIEPDSPVTYPLVEWTADRFAGKPGAGVRHLDRVLIARFRQLRSP